MRIPQSPPTDADCWKSLENPGRIRTIMMNVRTANHNGKYVHWDKLRFLEPPGDLSHEEWWIGLKMRRSGSHRLIPPRDRAGRGFTYSIVDPLPESLHLIDLSAGGTVRIPGPVLNPDTKDRYLVRSLIEESITSSQLEGAATTREVAKEMLREGRPPRDRSER